MIEEYHPSIAPIKKRIFSAVIDFILFWVLIFFLGYFFGESEKGKINADGSVTQFGYSFTGAASLSVLFIWLLFFPIIEGITGYSIGKKLVGLKVVQKDYTKISIVRSFVRHAFDALDLVLFVGFIIVARNNRYHQRIGDLLANTIVVDE